MKPIAIEPDERAPPDGKPNEVPEDRRRRAGERSGAGADSLRPYLAQGVGPEGRMRATALRAVHTLDLCDVLQVSTDERFFRVTDVARVSTGPDVRYKVTLQSVEGDARVTLVRGGREMVLAVARPPVAGAAASDRRHAPWRSP